jgi:hypothetical protein
LPNIFGAQFALQIPGIILNRKISWRLNEFRNWHYFMSFACRWLAEGKQVELDLIEALDSAWPLAEAMEEKNVELQVVNAEVEKAHRELQSAQTQILQRCRGKGRS